MSKSFRGSVVFAGLVAVVVGLSQVALAGGMAQTKDPASNPESSRAASQTKSKKRKKKKGKNISNNS